MTGRGLSGEPLAGFEEGFARGLEWMVFESEVSLEAGLVDELLLFYAPKILGDPAARPGLAITPRRLPEAMRLRMVDCDHFGNDVLITLRANELPHD